MLTASKDFDTLIDKQSKSRIVSSVKCFSFSSYVSVSQIYMTATLIPSWNYRR